jgi:hypothetical protein
LAQKRNRIAFFLLGICLIPTLVFLSLQIARCWVRFEMREALEQQQLQTLVINKSAIHWVEEGKELTINGALFDVAEAKAMNDTQVWVKGIFDYQEQAIEEKSDELLDTKNSKVPLFVKKVSTWQLFFYTYQSKIDPFYSPKPKFSISAPQACIERCLEVTIQPPKMHSV